MNETICIPREVYGLLLEQTKQLQDMKTRIDVFDTFVHKDKYLSTETACLILGLDPVEEVRVHVQSV